MNPNSQEKDLECSILIKIRNGEFSEIFLNALSDEEALMATKVLVPLFVHSARYGQGLELVRFPMEGEQ